MNLDIYREIQAIVNLLYLVRTSLDDPPAAERFVEMAEQRAAKLLNLQIEADRRENC